MIGNPAKRTTIRDFLKTILRFFGNYCRLRVPGSGKVGDPGSYWARIGGGRDEVFREVVYDGDVGGIPDRSVEPFSG